MQVPRPQALIFWARFALVVIGEAVVAEMMLSSKGVASLLVAFVELGELFGIAELSWNAERWTAGRAGGLLVSYLGCGGRTGLRPLEHRPRAQHVKNSLVRRDVIVGSIRHHQTSWSDDVRHNQSQGCRCTGVDLVDSTDEALYQSVASTAALEPAQHLHLGQHGVIKRFVLKHAIHCLYPLIKLCESSKIGCRSVQHSGQGGVAQVETKLFTQMGSSVFQGCWDAARSCKVAVEGTLEEG